MWSCAAWHGFLIRFHKSTNEVWVMGLSWMFEFPVTPADSLRTSLPIRYSARFANKLQELCTVLAISATTFQ